MSELGGDPLVVDPAVPVDLVVDHSLQVDYDGRQLISMKKNLHAEYARNLERYKFLKWGESSFRGFRVVPPGRGIVHQVNLEWLASVIDHRKNDGRDVEFFDTLVGTDSHTTMINGLGVLGWGVGGIEAEAAMVGRPIDLVLPDVVDVELRGQLAPGRTATDLTLHVVQMLRRAGVVQKFVEFYGDGVSKLSLADRATIANMAPEYGATCGYFPIDEVTLHYLRQSGRSKEQVELVREYAKAQGVFRQPGDAEPAYSVKLSLELSTIETSLAGPKRPEDRIELRQMKSAFAKSLSAERGHAGHGVRPQEVGRREAVEGMDAELSHGSVVIAAITSCTNTSNPPVMLAAGLLARNAKRMGLETKPWVKPSLAPGSSSATSKRPGYSSPYNTWGFRCWATAVRRVSATRARCRLQWIVRFNGASSWSLRCSLETATSRGESTRV